MEEYGLDSLKYSHKLRQLPPKGLTYAREWTEGVAQGTEKLCKCVGALSRLALERDQIAEWRTTESCCSEFQTRALTSPRASCTEGPSTASVRAATGCAVSCFLSSAPLPSNRVGHSMSINTFDFTVYKHLDTVEKYWASKALLFEAHGYVLRPRYRPGWTPSWRGKPISAILLAEDALSLHVRPWVICSGARRLMIIRLGRMS